MSLCYGNEFVPPTVRMQSIGTFLLRRIRHNRCRIGLNMAEFFPTHLYFCVNPMLSEIFPPQGYGSLCSWVIVGYELQKRASQKPLLRHKRCVAGKGVKNAFFAGITWNKYRPMNSLELQSSVSDTMSTVRHVLTFRKPLLPPSAWSNRQNKAKYPKGWNVSIKNTALHPKEP